MCVIMHVHMYNVNTYIHGERTVHSTYLQVTHEGSPGKTQPQVLPLSMLHGRTSSSLCT